MTLFALLAIAAAKPGYLGGSLVSTYEAAPVVSTYLQSVPTAVSHSSSSVVHSSAHIAEPIIAPVVKTHLTSVPVAHTYSSPLVYSSPLSYHHSAYTPLTYASGYPSW